MSIRHSSARRRLLMALAGTLSAATFRGPEDAFGAPATDDFMRVSRIITGTEAISPNVARRIQDLLAARDPKFTANLTDLLAAMQKAGGGRAQLLSGLSDAQVEFALSIAKPWYLGYVGTPSDFVLKDDAAFATFLEAQSYQKIIDIVPRPTYPSGNADSWVAAPQGVTAPPMPAQITDWTFHPGGPSAIQAPDAQWKRYATAAHASLEVARKQKPDAANSPTRS